MMKRVDVCVLRGGEQHYLKSETRRWLSTVAEHKGKLSQLGFVFGFFVPPAVG